MKINLDYSFEIADIKGAKERNADDATLHHPQERGADKTAEIPESKHWLSVALLHRKHRLAFRPPGAFNFRGETMKARQENYGALIQAGIAPPDADALQKISRSLHRLDEYSCNVGYEEDSRQAKREARLEKVGGEIAKEYGLLFYHQGDPRGWSVYVVKPEQLRGLPINQAYSYGLAVCPH